MNGTADELHRKKLVDYASTIAGDFGTNRSMGDRLFSPTVDAAVGNVPITDTSEEKFTI